MDAEDIQLLKEPFGALVREGTISKEKILSMLEGSNKIITVGDATTERIISFGITPDLSVTDGVERRSLRKRSIDFHAKEMFCANPPGTISKDALLVLQRALEMPPPVSVRVQGEEDLLALPLFIMAPEGSAEEKRTQARALMERIFQIRDV
jgi:uncharacterized protein (UPF0218 family)